MKERMKTHPQIARMALESFHVDDGLMGTDTVSEAIYPFEKRDATTVRHEMLQIKEVERYREGCFSQYPRRAER